MLFGRVKGFSEGVLQANRAGVKLEELLSAETQKIACGLSYRIKILVFGNLKKPSRVERGFVESYDMQGNQTSIYGLNP